MPASVRRRRTADPSRQLHPDPDLDLDHQQLRPDPALLQGTAVEEDPPAQRGSSHPERGLTAAELRSCEEARTLTPPPHP